MMILSGTSSPCLVFSAVSIPSSVPSSTSLRRIAPAAADATFAEEAIVMPLDQMRLHLPHRVEDHAHDNEQAGAAEKLRGDLWNLQTLAEEARQDRDHGKENRAGERKPRHGVIEEFRGRFAGPHARNVAAVFF